MADEEHFSLETLKKMNEFIEKNSLSPKDTDSFKIFRCLECYNGFIFPKVHIVKGHFYECKEHKDYSEFDIHKHKLSVSISDKEALIELENLDCNCNTCVYMLRNLEKLRSFDKLYDTLHGGHKQSWRIHYGHCVFFNKEVQFTPEQCQIHTQECFRNRKQYKLVLQAKEVL
jgi:hypothetical protein